MSDQLLDAILAQLARGDCPDSKWPDTRDEYWPLCPYHADSHSGSFAVGKKGFKCFACGEAGGLRKLAKHLGVAVLQRSGEGIHTHSSLTLDAYAQAKGLDAAFLRTLGIEESTYRGKKRLLIPYLDTSGHKVATRYRLSLHGPDRFRWARGSKVHLYGLWRLQEMRPEGYVILVEGESDCHTLWQHQLPALGVPGASTFKPEWVEHLNGLTVYVWQEPDQGGETLASKVGGALPEARLIVPPQGRKDVSECHLMGDDLARIVETLLAQARPWSHLVAERRDKRAAAAKELAGELLSHPQILEAVGDLSRQLGLVGEERLAKLLYLALTTRLLDKPVSVVVKGPSSGGKSFLVQTVLSAFPPEAYLDFTSMSEHALIYDDRPVAHRTIVLYEASGLGQDTQGEVNTLAYTVRSLLSEGRIKYVTVEKTADGMQARAIDRPGPTNLITTTTWTSLHAENETRLLSLSVRDDPHQTAGVFLALANRVSGHNATEVDLAPWQALQTWLDLAGVHAATIPYARALAKGTKALAVRLRRDFAAALSLVQAHAILHQANRQHDDQGRIIATIQDYVVVHGLVADIVDEGVEATVSPIVQETVEAVRDLIAEGQDDVSITQLATRLQIDRSTASRRVRMARESGYLRNLEEKRGRAARLVIGDSLPAEEHVLPHPDHVDDVSVCVHTLPESVQQCNTPETGSELIAVTADSDNGDGAETGLNPFDQRVLDALRGIGRPAGYPSIALRLRAESGATRQALERIVQLGLASRETGSMYRPAAEKAPVA
jgi:hypothetical protein